MKTILVIEDEPIQQMFLKTFLPRALQTKGVKAEVIVAPNHMAADALLAERPVDYIISDNRIEGQDFTGTNWVADRIRAGKDATPTLLHSADVDFRPKLPANDRVTVQSRGIGKHYVEELAQTIAPSLRVHEAEHRGRVNAPEIVLS